MKILTFLFLVAFGLNANCQIDKNTWYKNTKAFKVNSTVHYGVDSSISNNYLYMNYHLVTSDSIYQAQFIMYDNKGNRLLPANDLTKKGWRSSGTVKEFKLNNEQMNWTDTQLRDYFILPEIENIYEEINVTALY